MSRFFKKMLNSPELRRMQIDANICFRILKRNFSYLSSEGLRIKENKSMKCELTAAKSCF